MPQPVLAEKVSETVTSRGAIVLSEELPHVASVSLGVWVRTGSRHEARGEEGLTHFLEHMLFKGTRRRTARQIAEELDAVGGHLDASTSREFTCFFSRVLAEHLPMACDVLSDQLLNSLFRDEDVEREREVVLDEIKSCEDEPAELVMDHLLEAFYGEHPLARPILGNPGVIRALDRKAVAGYREHRYSADRIVISAAGHVKHDELLELLGPLLEGLPALGERREVSPPFPHARQRVTIRKQEQVHLALAAPALPFDHPGRYVFQVVNNILGGGVSSRLFQEIREKRGLAYGVSSGVEAFQDAGLLIIHVAADPDKYREVTEVIGGILAEMAAGRISDSEAVRGREQMKGNIFLALESTSTRMSRLASSRIFLGRVTPLSEVMGMVDAVTPDAVRAMAKELLDPARFSAAVLGPGSPERYRVPWLKVGEVVQA